MNPEKNLLLQKLAICGGSICILTGLFIQFSELGASSRERKCPNFETVAKEGFEPGLSRLRFRHSTAELLVRVAPTAVITTRRALHDNSSTYMSSFIVRLIIDLGKLFSSGASFRALQLHILQQN